MNGNTSSILKWWLKKRLKYNLGLLFTGLMGFVVQAVQYPFKASHDVNNEYLLFEMRSSAIGLIAFLIVANAAFTFGWVIDLIFNFKNSSLFRERLFLLGFWFAIASLILCITAFLQILSINL